MQAIRNIKMMIVEYFDNVVVEVFYPGIRTDVAIALGIAPNSPQFNAAWNALVFTSNGSAVYVDQSN